MHGTLSSVFYLDGKQEGAAPAAHNPGKDRYKLRLKEVFRVVEDSNGKGKVTRCTTQMDLPDAKEVAAL